MTEVWLIDEKALELFRVIEGGNEESLPIENNKDMRKFLCVDKNELLDKVK